MVGDYGIPYPMTHEGLISWHIWLYIDCNIIWFGMYVLLDGCNVFEVLGIINIRHYMPWSIRCEGSLAIGLYYMVLKCNDCN